MILGDRMAGIRLSGAGPGPAPGPGCGVVTPAGDTGWMGELNVKIASYHYAVVGPAPPEQCFGCGPRPCWGLLRGAVRSPPALVDRLAGDAEHPRGEAPVATGATLCLRDQQVLGLLDGG